MSTVYNNLRQMVIRSKAAGVIVIMQSTLHTGSGYPNSLTINQKVTQLNNLLSAMTSTQNETWLNLNNSMPEDGYLKLEYLLSDNLPLNKPTLMFIGPKSSTTPCPSQSRIPKN